MKRDDILEAALNEILKYDYDRASINSIIKNSNTSKGTLYLNQCICFISYLHCKFSEFPISQTEID